MLSRQHLVRHALGVFVLAFLLVLSPAATSSRAYAGVDFAVAALSLGSESSLAVPLSLGLEQAQAKTSVSRIDAPFDGVNRAKGESLPDPSCNVSALGHAQRGLYLQFCSWLC